MKRILKTVSQSQTQSDASEYIGKQWVDTKNPKFKGVNVSFGARPELTRDDIFELFADECEFVQKNQLSVYPSALQHYAMQLEPQDRLELLEEYMPRQVPETNPYVAVTLSKGMNAEQLARYDQISFLCGDNKRVTVGQFRLVGLQVSRSSRRDAS